MASRTIVVLGDSSSHAWRAGFLAAAVELNTRLYVISLPNCTPLLFPAETRISVSMADGDVMDRTYCTRGAIQRQAVDLVKSLRPDDIFLIAAWNFQKAQCEASQSLDKGINQRVYQTVKELDAVARLVVFSSWPLLPSPPKYETNRLSFITKSREVFVSRPTFKQDNACVEKLIQASVGPRTSVFNPSEKVCSEKCGSLLGSVPMYSDVYHISDVGALQFTQDIKHLILSYRPLVDKRHNLEGESPPQ